MSDKAKKELSVEEVKHIAKLAKLSLTEDEVMKFRGQLSSIIGYINKLQELDTSGVPQTNQVTGLKNVFKSDEVDENTGLSQSEALSNSEFSFEGYVAVPNVIDKS